MWTLECTGSRLKLIGESPLRRHVTPREQAEGQWIILAITWRNMQDGGVSWRDTRPFQPKGTDQPLDCRHYVNVRPQHWGLRWRITICLQLYFGRSRCPTLTEPLVILRFFFPPLNFMLFDWWFAFMVLKSLAPCWTFTSCCLTCVWRVIREVSCEMNTNHLLLMMPGELTRGILSEVS